MMKPHRLSGVLLVLFAAALAVAVWLVLVSRAAASIEDPPPGRVGQDGPNGPLLSFIDSPSPQCYLPVRETGSCYINLAYLYVSASPSYMLSMTVEIDGRLRSNYQGFFQQYMFVPGQVNGRGFKVPCGKPGAGGKAGMGYSYSYAIRAKDTAGLSSSNSGIVTCPADQVPVRYVSLSGINQTFTNLSHPLVATLSPLTATLPVTYTWLATDHQLRTVITGTSNQTSYAWDTPGLKTITVTASNSAGTAFNTHQVVVVPYSIYLPLVQDE